MPMPVKKTSASEYLVKSPALSVATKNEIAGKPAVETVVKSTPSPAPSSGGGGSPTPTPTPAPVVVITPTPPKTNGGITPETKAEYDAIYKQIQESGLQPTNIVNLPSVTNPQGKGILPSSLPSSLESTDATVSPSFSGFLKAVSTPEGTTIYTKPPQDSSVKPLAIVEKPEEKSIIQNITDTVGGAFGKAGEILGGAASVIFNPDVIDVYKYQATGPMKGSAEETFEDWSHYAAENVKTNKEAYTKLWENKDVVGIGSRVISSPYGSGVVFAGVGSSLGAFSMTKIGQTEAFNVLGRSITPSKTLNTGVGTVFTAEMAKGGYEAQQQGKLPDFAAGLAVLGPVGYYSFKSGYNMGAGYVQRTGAMSELTNPLERTQQQAIYDMMKTNESLQEPYVRQKGVYDITKVENPPPISATEKFFKSPVSKIIRKPAIVGSTAMDIQMGEFFRKGGYPEELLNIATERQKWAFEHGIQKGGTGPKPLKTSGQPGDIDIALSGRFATEKMGDVWSGKLDTHVHVDRPNQYHWGGYLTKPLTKSMVSFKGEPVKVKTLSIREQLLRYGTSSLPSEWETSYRSNKDILGMYDVADVLSFQKGGGKLRGAMERYMYPERYQSPRVTIGERIIKKIGGRYKPKYEEIFGGEYIEPVYPKKTYYPSFFGGSDSYGKYSYKSDVTPTKYPTYNKNPPTISTTYTSSKTNGKPNYPTTYYKPSTPPTDGYSSTKYTPPKNPDITPPTEPYTKNVPDEPKYTPPYNPPNITPPYIPPYHPPPVVKPKTNPPYNPPYKPISPTKAAIDEYHFDLQNMKRRKKLFETKTTLAYKYRFRKSKIGLPWNTKTTFKPPKIKEVKL